MLRRLFVVPVLVALTLSAPSVAVPAALLHARVELPARLSDREFWNFVEEFSEPNGFFRSENFVSNEDTFQFIIPKLTSIVKPGGVYLGVGPDQNFTYIVALKPRIAFITDIRRGNLHEHLMYKALFELSADRADFLSRLFSRPRPAGLSTASTAEELFEAFRRVEVSPNLFRETTVAVADLMTNRHRFALSKEDVAGMDYVLSAFRDSGPYLSYAGSGVPPAGVAMFGRNPRYPTYQDLQTATDGTNRNRAYLGSEENYRTLKAFQERNLLVPLVGDFAGPKALRAVGNYVRSHGAVVTTFYLSNVEQYLFGDGIWLNFADNVGTMPLDESSTFIRSCFNNCVSTTSSRAVMQLDSMMGLLKDARDGRIRSYIDVLSHVR
jgi:hypothetical protein